MNELQLVKSKDFGEVQCDFYQQGSEYFMTRDQIGTALEYCEPRKQIQKIHERHAERLDPFSSVVKLTTLDGKVREVMVYSRKGIMEICRWSKQPKANEFMDFVWEVMDNLMSSKARVVMNGTSEDKLLRARAMLMNAQTRQFKAIMGTIADKTRLASIAAKVLSIKALETVFG